MLTVLAWRYIAVVPNRPLGTPCPRCLRVSCCNRWGPVRVALSHPGKAGTPSAMPACTCQELSTQLQATQGDPVLTSHTGTASCFLVYRYQLQAPLVLHAYHGMGTNCASCTCSQFTERHVQCITHPPQMPSWVYCTARCCLSYSPPPTCSTALHAQATPSPGRPSHEAVDHMPQAVPGGLPGCRVGRHSSTAAPPKLPNAPSPRQAKSEKTTTTASGSIRLPTIAPCGAPLLMYLPGLAYRPQPSTNTTSTTREGQPRNVYRRVLVAGVVPRCANW